MQSTFGLDQFGPAQADIRLEPTRLNFDWGWLE